MISLRSFTRGRRRVGGSAEAGRAGVTVLRAASLAGAVVVLARSAPLSAGDGRVASDRGWNDEEPRWEATFPNYAQTLRLRRLQGTACGPLSLLAILTRMALPVSTTEAKAMIASAGVRGTSLLQLKDMAERNGLHALGVELSVRQLRETGLYAIARLAGRRFVAVTGYSQHGVEVVPPLEPPRVVSEEGFEKLFGKPGRALLLSTAPLSAEELGLAPASSAPRGRESRPLRGPSLRLSTQELWVGRIHTAGWKRTLALHNDGSSDLRILSANVSCASTRATVSRTVVRPGESATLKVAGRQLSPGGFGCEVLLATNEQNHPLVRVPVAGYFEPPVILARPAVTLSGVFEGQRARACVPLLLAPGVRVDQIVTSIPGGTPLAVRADSGAGGRPRLLVEWHGATDPGWYRYRIGVGAEGLDVGGSWALLLAVEVIPLAQAFPSVLVIGAAEMGGPWRRRVELRVHESLSDRFAHRWSAEAFSQAVRVRRRRLGEGKVEVLLSPAERGALTALRGDSADLVFRFGGGAACAVRVRAGAADMLRSGRAGARREKLRQP